MSLQYVSEREFDEVSATKDVFIIIFFGGRAPEGCRRLKNSLEKIDFFFWRVISESADIRI